MQLRDGVGLALSFPTMISRNGLDSTKSDDAPSWRCPGVCEAGVDLRPCVGIAIGTRPVQSGSLT